MHKLTQIALAGSMVALTGCQINWGNKKRALVHYRLGLETQYYDIQKINTPFETPNKGTPINLGVHLGPSFSLYNSKETRVMLGLDARINTDALEDNRSSQSHNSGACVRRGELSMIGQGIITGIPYAGINHQVGDIALKLELGLPYTRWIVETGDTSGIGCFGNVQRSSTHDLGQKARLGFSKPDKQYVGINGLFLTYERYRNDLIDVDIYGIEFSMDF